MRWVHPGEFQKWRMWNGCVCEFGAFSLSRSWIAPVCVSHFLSGCRSLLRRQVSLKHVPMYSSFRETQERGQAETGMGGSRWIILQSGFPSLLRSWYLSWPMCASCMMVLRPTSLQSSLDFHQPPQAPTDPFCGLTYISVMCGRNLFWRV